MNRLSIVKYMYEKTYVQLANYTLTPDVNKFKEQTEKSVLDAAKPVIEVIGIILCIPSVITIMICLFHIFNNLRSLNSGQQGDKEVSGYAIGLIGGFIALIIFGGASAWASGLLG